MFLPMGNDDRVPQRRHRNRCSGKILAASATYSFYNMIILGASNSRFPIFCLLRLCFIYTWTFSTHKILLHLTRCRLISWLSQAPVIPGSRHNMPVLDLPHIGLDWFPQMEWFQDQRMLFGIMISNTKTNLLHKLLQEGLQPKSQSFQQQIYSRSTFQRVPKSKSLSEL